MLFKQIFAFPSFGFPYFDYVTAVACEHPAAGVYLLLSTLLLWISINTVRDQNQTTTTTPSPPPPLLICRSL
jgi:hypothetical protein